MEDEEDCGAWVQFSDVAVNARLRNAMEMFAKRSPTQGPGSKEAAPAEVGARATAGALTSREDETDDGDKILLMRKVSQ